MVPDLTGSFTVGLRHILGGNLVGAYVYGAAAFADGTPLGDVDFHVIVRQPLDECERAALEELHEELARDFPPLGAELDGYYLLLEDAQRRKPPQSQMWARATDTAWALHRAHILAGRCIVLYGPDPATIYPLTDWPELEAALWSELDFVERHLHDYPAYCILNLCRLIYSFRMGDVVVSKTAAAAWALEHLPAWRRHFNLAQKSYAGQATAEDQAFMHSEVQRFYKFALARIKKNARVEKP